MTVLNQQKARPMPSEKATLDDKSVADKVIIRANANHTTLSAPALVVAEYRQRIIAEALADYKRVLGECEAALLHCDSRHFEGDNVGLRFKALAAIAELKKDN